MQAAFDQARTNLSQGHVPIGAVVVHVSDQGCELIAEGRNVAEDHGSAVWHAEMAALIEAGRRGEGVEGAWLVTTLEPCLMCFGAMIECRLAGCVYALEAPQNGALSRYGHTHDSVIGGVMRDESRKLFMEWQTRYGVEVPGNFVEQLLACT